MGQCLIHRTSAPFKAFIEATATPGSTVTATIGAKVFTGVADASTGKVRIIVKKKGTYTVTSDATNTQTLSVDVLKSKLVYPANVTGLFDLSIANSVINQLTAASITVNRTASAYGEGSIGVLTADDAIYYGDVLNISVANTSSTIYTAPTMTVNGNAFTSGDDFTVGNADVAVVATNAVNSYTMTITNTPINGKTPATISVKKTDSPYAGVDKDVTYTATTTVYYGDVLSVSVANANSTVYNNPTMKVAGTARTSPYSHTVTGAFTAESSSSVKSWTITISNGAGCTISIKRSKSPYAGASIAAIANGTTVYYGDELAKNGTCGANTGFNSYAIAQSGVSGTANNGPWTVTGGTVYLKATASPVKYTLTSSGLNANNPVTIKRTARSAAGTAAGVSTNVNLSSGAAIYYDDTLQFTNAPKTNYNGNYSFTGTNSNASSQTATLSRYVRGNVTVTSTATRQTVTISFNRVTGSGTKTQYFKGTITINKGDSLNQSINKSSTGVYQYSMTKYNGTYKISKAVAGATSFDIYFLNDAGNYAQTRSFSSSSIGNNSTAITSNKSFS